MESIVKKTKSLFLFLVFCTSAYAYALEFKHGKVTLEEFDDYMKCQKRDYSGDVCIDALKVWLKAHPEDSFRAGKQVRLTAAPWLALSYFASAFEKKLSDAKCDDEDVKMSVESGIALASENAPPEREAAVKIYCNFCGTVFKKSNIMTKKLCK